LPCAPERFFSRHGKTNKQFLGVNFPNPIDSRLIGTRGVARLMGTLVLGFIEKSAR